MVLMPTRVLQVLEKHFSSRIQQDSNGPPLGGGPLTGTLLSRFHINGFLFLTLFSRLVPTLNFFRFKMQEQWILSWLFNSSWNKYCVIDIIELWGSDFLKGPKCEDTYFYQVMKKCLLHVCVADISYLLARSSS